MSKARKVIRSVEAQPVGLVFLADLIERWYTACLAHLKENPNLEDFPKTGDFLKMIDAYMKHAPESKAQAELWKLLDRVREQELPSPPEKKKPTRSNRRRKVA